jgi:hypothetical protein
MTDRELLELAAKAAGEYHGMWSDEENAFIEPYGEDFIEWNPLDDDGDALRLAVRLEIVVEYRRDVDTAFSFNYAQALGIGQNNKNLDPYAATRRAIVRAAAEIGKVMK